MRFKKTTVFIVALIMLALFYVNFFNSPKVLAIHGSDTRKDFLVKNIPFSDSDKIKWWIILESKPFLPVKLTMFQSGTLMVSIKNSPPRIQVLFQTMILITYCALMT
jgi:hypothetical protein